MSPLQFLARLAALIPPPRHPLIRFYGVFAPHSSWREKVVPARSPCCHQQSEDGICSAQTIAGTPATVATTTTARIAKSSVLPILARRCSEPTPYCTVAVAPKYVAPAAFREPSIRIDWAELLKRVHDVDSLACPCGGRPKFVALNLIYWDDQSEKEYLVRTFKMTAYHFKGQWETWQIFPDDVLAAGYAYEGHEFQNDGTYRRVDFYVWFSTSAARAEQPDPCGRTTAHRNR